jgi:hypothetical protein
MCVVDQLLEELQTENKWFKKIRKAEGRLRTCTNNNKKITAMYIKGLLIRYQAGERSKGLLEELEGVNKR